MRTHLTRREILAGLAASGLFAACGGDDGGGRSAQPTGTGPATSGGSGPTTSPSAGGPGGASELRSAQARLPGADPVGAGAILHPFATALHRSVGGQAPGNLVLSPASVAFALAMTRNGAAGTTAQEMDQVLRAGSVDRVNAALNAVDSALAGRSGRRQAGFDSTGELSLSLANALWGERSMTFLEPFLDALAGNYGASLRLVEYAGDPAGARRAINDWVAAQTRDRIRDLLPEDAVDAETRLVLTNAIALSAPWDTPFEPSATADGPFNRLSGGPVTVPFMRQTEQLPYAKGDGWEAVELPYVGRELGMTVVVPDAGRFAAVEAGVDLAAAVAALQPRQVALGLPRWTFRTQAMLAEVLAAMGMPTAFTDAADFSGMTADAALAISRVVHQAFIAVDEKGTEAAAATAVAMRPTSANLDPPVAVTVDRPFLFAVRDVPTNTLLFLGRVVDPTAG
jgi:serpin B